MQETLLKDRASRFGVEPAAYMLRLLDQSGTEAGTPTETTGERLRRLGILGGAEVQTARGRPALERN